MSNESKASPPDVPPPSWTVGARQSVASVDEDMDAVLVRRCQQGDREAFGLLVARHDKRVYALVARVLGLGATADDVDDVAQEVFIQAWRALPKFRQDARFSTWLYRIATNMAIKQWHRNKRRAQTVSEEELPNTVRAALAIMELGPEDVAAQRARDKALRTAIDQLPEKQRTVILLHYFEEYTCEDIGALLGCSVGTVWSRLHYGCRKLRESVSWLGKL
ncbi:MAG: sigma-70 family RNA polymerase sigma factor [Armatimonadota bacterium]|nr:sigma-70 family RNA polymerase sigma factor [Armatimonadota bacterium]